MEADTSIDVAGEHHPRIEEVEDGESSEAATPTVTMAGWEADLGTADDDASESHSKSRASSGDRSSSLSVREVPLTVGRADYAPRREPPSTNTQSVVDEDMVDNEEDNEDESEIEYWSKRHHGPRPPFRGPPPHFIRAPSPRNYYRRSRSRSRSRLRWRKAPNHNSSPRRAGRYSLYSDGFDSDSRREYRPTSSTSRSRSPSPDEWDIYDIDSDGDESKGPEETLAQEWSQPTSVLEDGTATELIVAQSIEHRAYKSGSEEIVLVSPARPPPLSDSAGQEAEKSRGQFRWL